MSQLQEWFSENPKARPLMTFALLCVFCLGIGIWSTAGGKKPIRNINRTPEAVVTPDVPTMVGETPLIKPATTAWISQKETPLYDEPGLNRPVIRKLNQWEEVAWLQEKDGWDQLRLSDGSQGWLPVKFLSFVKPADLDKPNEAEVTVMAFYAAVVRKDYAAAYAYLAGPWKAELDFQSFVDGYSRTSSLRTEIDRVIPMGDQRFEVDVKMKAMEEGQEIPYMGSYLVEKIGEEWCLSSGSLTVLAGPRADPRLPALRVPLIETPVPEEAASSTPLPEPEDEADMPPVDDAAPDAAPGDASTP